MFSVADFQIPYIIESIDNGHAVQIVGQSFTDGEEGEFAIDFYKIDDAVVRIQYDLRTTITHYNEVDGDNAERLLA